MSLKSKEEFIKIEKKSLSRDYINKTKRIDELDDIINLAYSLGRSWISDYGVGKEGDVNIYCYMTFGSSVSLSITLNKDQNIEKDFNIFFDLYEDRIKKVLGVKEYEVEESGDLKYRFGDYWNKQFTIVVNYSGGKCERVKIRTETKTVEKDIYEIKCHN